MEEKTVKPVEDKKVKKKERFINILLYAFILLILGIIAWHFYQDSHNVMQLAPGYMDDIRDPNTHLV